MIYIVTYVIYYVIISLAVPADVSLFTYISWGSATRAPASVSWTSLRWGISLL